MVSLGMRRLLSATECDRPQARTSRRFPRDYAQQRSGVPSGIAQALWTGPSATQWRPRAGRCGCCRRSSRTSRIRLSRSCERPPGPGCGGCEGSVDERDHVSSFVHALQFRSSLRSCPSRSSTLAISRARSERHEVDQMRWMFHPRSSRISCRQTSWARAERLLW